MWGTILLTFIKLPFVIKIFILSIFFSGCLHGFYCMLYFQVAMEEEEGGAIKGEEVEEEVIKGDNNKGM